MPKNHGQCISLMEKLNFHCWKSLLFGITWIRIFQYMYSTNYKVCFHNERGGPDSIILSVGNVLLIFRCNMCVKSRLGTVTVVITPQGTRDALSLHTFCQRKVFLKFDNFIIFPSALVNFCLVFLCVPLKKVVFMMFSWFLRRKAGRHTQTDNCAKSILSLST